MDNLLQLFPALLPTEDVSKLLLVITDKMNYCGRTKGKLEIHDSAWRKDDYFEPHHIYLFSNREIKIGDWCINVNGDTIYKVSSVEALTNWRKIEFTNDPKLMDDGVPALPENALIDKEDTFGPYDNTESFLDEFAKRYNDIQVKNIDLDKFADKFIQEDEFDSIRPYTEAWQFARRMFSKGYNLAEQENSDKKFSADDMLLMLKNFADECEGNDDLICYEGRDIRGKKILQAATNWFDDYLKSITQQKSDMQIFCESEDVLVNTIVNDNHRWGELEQKIKLINGQPIIHFKS